MIAKMRIEISPDSIERARQAVREEQEAIAEGGVRFLLDGLGVATIEELKRLVDTGRETDAIMGPVRDELRAAGVPEDLLPQLATMAEWKRYPQDAGMQLIYECLSDRHGDPEQIAGLMDDYDGDFWFDYVGPMLDRVEHAIGVPDPE